jgi:hypothetical protein
MADIYQLVSDELGNGISEISEESFITRQGKHKKFIINITCRSHSPMMNETRVNRRIEYKTKKARLRLWIHKC